MSQFGLICDFSIKCRYYFEFYQYRMGICKLRHCYLTRPTGWEPADLPRRSFLLSFKAIGSCAFVAKVPNQISQQRQILRPVNAGRRRNTATLRNFCSRFSRLSIQKSFPPHFRACSPAEPLESSHAQTHSFDSNCWA